MIEIQVSVLLLRIPTPADVSESEPDAEGLPRHVREAEALMRSGLKMLAGQLQGAAGPKGTMLIEALAEAFARPLGEHEVISIIPRVAPAVGFLGPPVEGSGA